MCFNVTYDKHFNRILQILKYRKDVFGNNLKIAL